MTSRKTSRKFKLLLDEGLPPRSNYPNLNNFHNLRHITHDYSFMGYADHFVYKKATAEDRMVIVLNTKDFRPLIVNDGSSVISLSTNLSNEEADLKIMKFLREISIGQTKGHLISISNQGAVISKPQAIDK